MTRDVFEKVREIDHVVLQHVQEGQDDVHQISQATGHGNKKIGYSFDKLEELGLLQVETPDGMVETVVNGQKRKFKAPKTGELTDLGQRYLDQNEPVDLERYEEMTRAELIQRVLTLEEEVDTLRDQIAGLEEKLEIFRKQVQRRL